MSGGGANARLLGKWGEQLIAQDLRRRGWKILELNYHCRCGEVDIIAADRRYIVFVEVKLRKNSQFGSAGSAVTWEKQRKLRTTAQFYLMSHPTQLQPRFDVAEVYAPQGMNTSEPRISYLEDAF